jgi:hypothetical protein
MLPIMRERGDKEGLAEPYSAGSSFGNRLYRPFEDL